MSHGFMGHSFIDNFVADVTFFSDEWDKKIKNVPSITEKCNNSQNLKVNKLLYFSVAEGTFLLFSVIFLKI